MQENVNTTRKQSNYNSTLILGRLTFPSLFLGSLFAVKLIVETLCSTALFMHNSLIVETKCSFLSLEVTAVMLIRVRPFCSQEMTILSAISGMLFIWRSSASGTSFVPSSKTIRLDFLPHRKRKPSWSTYPKPCRKTAIYGCIIHIIFFSGRSCGQTAVTLFRYGYLSLHRKRDEFVLL